METIQTIKAFFARLAGAPLASRPAAAPRPVARRRRASGLYDDEPVAPSGPAARLTPRLTTKQRDGDEGEALARRYLECSGLTFVAANVRYRDGELDLVMRDPGRRPSDPSALVFVEVRRRAKGSHGGAAASVTREKRRRLAAAAAHYLVGLGLRSLPACRFDVVTLDGDSTHGFRIEWIRDAFRDDGR